MLLTHSGVPLSSIISSQLQMHISVMNCLPSFSLPAFFANCIQTLSFYHNDDNSFWDGEEGEGPNESDRENPGTATSHARSDGMIYSTNKPLQTRVEADLVTCQLKPITGELFTDLEVSTCLTLRMTTEPLVLHSRSQREISRLSNSMDSDTIELPSIPQEWKCYSKTRTYL